MSKKILFITSNQFKFEWAKRRLDSFDINIENKMLDISEPREFEVEEVVNEKAENAMKKIADPFIIEDTSFRITSLKNFPSTYIKLAVEYLGIDKICTLVRREKDKSACFKSSLAYVDENKKIHIFTCEDWGKISSEPKGEDSIGFGDLMKIFIPNKSKKTLAEMDKKEFEKYEKDIEKEDHYVKFAEWLKGKY